VTRLVLPLPPNRANARWHWRTEKKLRENYYLICTVLHPRPLKTVLTRCSIACDLYLWGQMDVDNAYGRLKWALDWMQGRYILDDSPDVIETLTLKQHIDRKNQRLEIEVEEA